MEQEIGRAIIADNDASLVDLGVVFTLTEVERDVLSRCSGHSTIIDVNVTNHHVVRLCGVIHAVVKVNRREGDVFHTANHPV